MEEAIDDQINHTYQILFPRVFDYATYDYFQQVIVNVTGVEG